LWPRLELRCAPSDVVTKDAVRAKQQTSCWVWQAGIRHATPESKMLIHLPIIILTSFHPIAIADAVPKFDIARECQAEGGTMEIRKRCVDDETQARDQLQAEWLQFSHDAKTQCSAEASHDGTSSYVEFVTCLEMERDVKLERESNKTSK
jgi:hypothetical protein